jgi:cation:H+ antiporter
MNVTTLIGLGIGLALLVAGAEALVRGASRLAGAMGLSPLVIGLTIVAYGTSAPELAVSLKSIWSDQAAVAVGNVIGSNLFNVLCILGFSSIITPLVVAQQLIRLDVPIMIAVSVLMFVLGLDGQISRFDGILLTLGGVVYTWFLFTQGDQEPDEMVQEEYNREFGPGPKSTLALWVVNLGLIIGGTGLLVGGASLMVENAVKIAEYFHVSKLIIGLTIVAMGTSLPELATSVIASLHRERDIAVGNVVGSNIFNILAVLGIASTFSMNGIQVPEEALRLDIPVMIAVAVACLPIFFSGNVISRWEGMVFLAYYAAYSTYIVLDATNHQGLSVFSAVLLFFVIPLTVITLLTIVWRSLYHKDA